MANNFAQQQAAQERSNIADVCGKPIKASLRPHTSAPPVRELAKDALKHTGKQECAAEDLGMHRTRLNHKLADGTLTLAQVEELGPTYAANFGRLLWESYGPLSASPAARLRQLADEQARIVDEMRQLSEFIA